MSYRYTLPLSNLGWGLAQCFSADRIEPLSSGVIVRCGGVAWSLCAYSKTKKAVRYLCTREWTHPINSKTIRLVRNFLRIVFLFPSKSVENHVARFTTKLAFTGTGPTTPPAAAALYTPFVFKSPQLF